MRRLTMQQLEILDDTNYQVTFKALIADGDGDLRDYRDQFGYDWIDAVTIDFNIDQPCAQLTLTLRRDILDGLESVKSLSPFRGDSDMNRNSVNAFSPAIDAGRVIQFWVAVTEVGTEAVDADFQNMFEGVIDQFAIERNPMVITSRDKAGKLQERYVEVETNYGSSDGTPLADVLQNILNDWGDGEPLFCPVDPDWDIVPYTQSRMPVMDALQTLAGLRGWDVRYLWDDDTAAWLLTLNEIDREKTIPDRTIAKARYIDVNTLTLKRNDVRNVVWVYFTDSATGNRLKVESKDDDSITRFGRLWMDDDEAANSPISSTATAQIFADSMRDDLKDPKADQTIEMHFDWSTELNDLQLYKANGEHYDEDQSWAVVSYQHNFSANKARTTVSVRGRPCGRYRGWLANRNNPVSSPSSSGPTLIVNGVVSAVDVSINVIHTGTLTLSTDGGLTFADPTITPGITSYPYIVDRPDSSAGLTAIRWVFKASLNGQAVTHPVDIPATDADAGVALPPDSAYTGVAVGITNVPVHAEYAGRIVLAAMPTARTELDDATRIRIDTTPFDSVRIVANVLSVGAAGSQLVLEWFDPSTASWNDISGVPCATPLDALGAQTSAPTVMLPAITGDLVFRVMTYNGDGTATPVLGNVHVQFYPANLVAQRAATLLYLRDEPPSSAPTAADFPFSVAMPAHSYATGSNITASADAVRSLRPDKGTDITAPGRQIDYGVDDTNQPRDLFPGAFVSEPFTENQAVASGDWELGAVAARNASHVDLIPKVSIFLLRQVIGVWTVITTIYDVHDSAATGRTFVYGGYHVTKKTVSGASFAALAGDVIAVEIWAHLDNQSGHATGHAPVDVDDGAGALYFDGALDVPAALADSAAWPGGVPASYIQPPTPLSVGS